MPPQEKSKPLVDGLQRRQIPQHIETDDVGALFLEFYKEYRDNADMISKDLCDIKARLGVLERALKDWAKICRENLKGMLKGAWKIAASAVFGLIVGWLISHSPIFPK